MSVEQQYIDLFAQQEETICRHSADVLNRQRKKAFDCFRQSGFPTRKEENINIRISASFLNPITVLI